MKNNYQKEVEKAFERLSKGKKPALVFSPVGDAKDGICEFSIRCNVTYVKEVVGYILTQNEYGHIRIRSHGKTHEFEYERDRVQPIPIDLMEKKVKQISSEGGWSRMDYLIL